MVQSKLEQTSWLLLQVLLWAQARSNSQGVLKIPAGAVAPSPTARQPVVDLETQVSAHIDGCSQYGMLVMQQATRLAIGKAVSAGIGIVGFSNTASSTGALG